MVKEIKMSKRIVAKTGEYQKDGQTKGEYTKLGVMLDNNNGEYMLLDPSVSLAGVLVKQNALAAKTGGQQRDMVMISIFSDDNQQQSNQGFQQQGQGFQQQQQQGQQQGYNQGNASSFNQAPPQR
tara:strand:+ start:46 stop:420 length:375 start_codon:yes stop_codon:yes gene_type:complete